MARTRMKPNPDRYIEESELAAEFGVHKNTLYLMRREGVIPPEMPLKFGHVIAYRRSDFPEIERLFMLASKGC